MKAIKVTNFLLGAIAMAFCVSLGMTVQGETNSPALQYAKIYERELTGDLVGALSDYRASLATVVAADPGLAEKILYRIGVCEQSLGNPEETRKVWKHLVDSYPASDAYVLHARAALKFLERELDRMVVEVALHTGPSNSLPRVGQWFVFTGEWGHEPVVLAGVGGSSRMDRKVAGRSPDGRRYCLVYAEDSLLPLVAADVLFEGQDSQGGVRSPNPNNSQEGSAAVLKGQISLSPSLPLSGRVVDSLGRSIRGALIHVTGFKADIPLPFDSLFPPIFSTVSGEFTVPGLVVGLRYVVTAEKKGYRMVSAVEKILASTPESRLSGEETCAPLVLQSLGEISLRGRVVDEAGRPVQAIVSVYSSPPVSREMAKTTTDEDGRFTIRELKENWVILKVDGEGGLPRSIPGIKPMGQEIDVVVKWNRKNQKGQPQGVPAMSESVSGHVDEAGSQDSALHSDMPTSQEIGRFFKTLHWSRGNSETDDPLRWEDMKGHVVVLHFGSAYGEAFLRAQYPKEAGSLSQLMKLYGDQGLVCIWVLPEGEGKGDSERAALELYPELPIAALMSKPDGDVSALDRLWGLEQGNIVIRRNGVAQPICPDLSLFKAVKEAVISP